MNAGLVGLVGLVGLAGLAGLAAAVCHAGTRPSGHRQLDRRFLQRSAPAFVYRIHGTDRCRMGTDGRLAWCTSNRGKVSCRQTRNKLLTLPTNRAVRPLAASEVCATKNNAKPRKTAIGSPDIASPLSLGWVSLSMLYRKDLELRSRVAMATQKLARERHGVPCAIVAPIALHACRCSEIFPRSGPLRVDPQGGAKPVCGVQRGEPAGAAAGRRAGHLVVRPCAQRHAAERRR